MSGLARSATPELRRPQPSRAESHERVGYRLFPPAAQAQKSNNAGNQHTLLRVAPTHGRRSFSLDDSRRGNGTGEHSGRHVSPPRKGSTTRLDRNAIPILTSTGASGDPQASRALPFKLRGYKPRLIEDVNHARSTSAPLNVLERTRNQPSVATIMARTHERTATDGGSPIPGLPKQRIRRVDIEKPLPPPPPENLSPHRAHSPVESLNSESARDLTIRTISPSWTLLSENDTYSSLSEDAKVRELMGIPTPDLSSIGGSLASSRANSPTSGMVESVDSILSATGTHIAVEISDSPVQVSPARSMTITRKAVPGLQRKASEVTLLPKAYTTPALTKKASPETTHCMDQQELIPPALNLGAGRPVAPANGHSPATSLSSASPVIVHVEDAKSGPDLSGPLQTLQDLADQSATVSARYDALRAERHGLSNTISSCLREEQTGPNYTNLLLDQQMSLSTISSSMDVCVAKLKALEKGRVACVAEIVTLTTVVSPQSHMNSRSPASLAGATKPLASPAMTTAGIISRYGARQRALSDVERRSTGLNIRVPSQRYEYPELMQARILNVDESHDSQVISVRRAELKGVKAVKVSHKVAQSVNGSIFTPQYAADRHAIDHFISTCPSSPPPDRPLPKPPVNIVPLPPSMLKLQKCVVAPAEHRIMAPAVTDLNTTAALYESDDEDDGPQWPLAEDYKPRNVKSQCSSTKSTQTVHVYLAPDEPMPHPPLPDYAHEGYGGYWEYAQAW
ncbi:hypothetical protein B0A48_06332 [Cryoendolithus antarcticus]|uniref:Uncharacterized protein n=1 Tax=Cryoendolithus antarcticus TaxID=1507870 RepID=A0A1V8TBA6_9PEZI|nr:hypothetical protein B0A48_06332 [Cryoendolithus antarcticus]